MFSPNILWAESSDIVIITIEVINSKDETINITDKNISIIGNSDEKEYCVDLYLFDEIDSNKSLFKINPRNIEITLYKLESYLWNKLSSSKRNDIYTDWQKWNKSHESESCNESDLESEYSDISEELNNNNLNNYDYHTDDDSDKESFSDEPNLEEISDISTISSNISDSNVTVDSKDFSLESLEVVDI